MTFTLRSIITQELGTIKSARLPATNSPSPSNLPYKKPFVDTARVSSIHRFTREMKLLLLLSVVATVVVAVPYGLDQEFAMVPDSDGNWKLVNINEDPEPESFFNPVSDVRFLLFTRRNPDVPQILSLDEAVSIESSNFNAAHPTR